MKTVKVLIADDSVIYRSQIRAALASVPGLDVVGAVGNGSLALSRLNQNDIDLLILDMEMPEMDGLQTLEAMSQRSYSCKTIVFSAVTQHAAGITLKALQLGASDFVAKPGGAGTGPIPDGNPSEKIRAALEPKVNALFPRTSANPIQKAPSLPGQKNSNVIWDLFRPKVIVIGSSTGGPTVLEKIFSELAPPLTCPILITQHMPPIFTATFAERLQSISGISVREAIQGACLEPNTVYVAPGDYHMTVTGTPTDAKIHLDQGPMVNFVRPAVDPLFASAASLFGPRTMGLILTGMGCDGRVGAEAIKAQGGAVVIQSEKTCVVFGMPGAVMESGAYDLILDPPAIIDALVEKSGAARKSPPKKAVGS